MISSFQILGQTIEVIIDNEYCHKNKCYGQFIPFENKIIIANKFKSKKVWIEYKQEIIDATFFHELVHCLLFHFANSNPIVISFGFAFTFFSNVLLFKLALPQL